MIHSLFTSSRHAFVVRLLVLAQRENCAMEADEARVINIAGAERRNSVYLHAGIQLSCLHIRAANKLFRIAARQPVFDILAGFRLECNNNVNEACSEYGVLQGRNGRSPCNSAAKSLRCFELLRQLVFQNHVAYRNAPSWPQHSKRLAKNLSLIQAQTDDSI